MYVSSYKNLQINILSSDVDFTYPFYMSYVLLLLLVTQQFKLHRKNTTESVIINDVIG